MGGLVLDTVSIMYDVMTLITSSLIHVHASDHFGVIKAMLDVRLIPKVITGTSAGALST